MDKQIKNIDEGPQIRKENILGIEPNQNIDPDTELTH
jgi:hypothetical protein